MKTAKLICITVIGVTSLLTLLTTVSCTKETILIERDTVKIKDTLVNDSLLSAASWEIFEAKGLLANTPLRYQKGGSGNNWAIDGDYYVFNKDNTGYAYDGVKNRHEILSWNISRTGERIKLVMVYENAPNYTSLITWDNLIYKNGNLQYTDYYKDALTWANYHGQAIRTPKK